MDYSKDELDKTGGAGAAKIHKIRITLTSRNVKPLEKCELRLSHCVLGESCTVYGKVESVYKACGTWRRVWRAVCRGAKCVNCGLVHRQYASSREEWTNQS
jgi:hypothetical protein